MLLDWVPISRLFLTTPWTYAVRYIVLPGRALHQKPDKGEDQLSVLPACDVYYALMHSRTY